MFGKRQQTLYIAAIYLQIQRYQLYKKEKQKHILHTVKVVVYMHKNIRTQYVVLSPFLLTIKSIRLCINRIVLFIKSTGTLSRVILHSSGKFLQIFAFNLHLQGNQVQLIFENMKNIFDQVQIRTTWWNGKLSCPYLIPSRSGFTTIL